MLSGSLASKCPKIPLSCACCAGGPVCRPIRSTAECLAIERRHVDAHHAADHIYLREGGVPYSAHVFRRKLTRWCVRAKIAAKPPYALRHTFATLQAEGNATIVVL